MPKITGERRDAIRAAMAGLGGKAAKHKAKLLAKEFGVTESTIYAHTRDVRTARKTRSDKGRLRAIDPEQADKLVYLTVKKDLSAPLVTEIAAANHIGEFSTSTYNRLLRKRRVSRRENRLDLTPWQSWQASAPNIVHQIDTTVSQQFYIDDDGGVGYEAPAEVNKNKPGNRKPRLTLFCLIDDFSRVRFARFMLGNHTEAWMNALFEAWREKDDAAGFPFHGLPKILYTDNDSVVKSSKFRHAIETVLGVKIITHAVGASRSKGKVENSFKLLQNFEKVTIGQQWQSLDEANAALLDFLYWVNNKRHGGTGEIPFESWIKIKKKRLNAVPDAELFQTLSMSEDRRKIYPDLTINLNGKKFQLPFRPPYINHVGETVPLYWYRSDLSKIFIVLDGKSYEVEYAEKGMRGIGKHTETPVPDFLKYRQEIEEQPEPQLRQTGFFKERHRRAYLTKTAIEFAGKGKLGAGGPVRSRAWFILQLTRDFIITPPATADDTAFVNSVFQGRSEAPDKELRDIIQKLKAGEIAIQRSGQANEGNLHD